MKIPFTCSCFVSCQEVYSFALKKMQARRQSLFATNAIATDGLNGSTRTLSKFHAHAPRKYVVYTEELLGICISLFPTNEIFVLARTDLISSRYGGLHWHSTLGIQDVLNLGSIHVILTDVLNFGRNIPRDMRLSCKAI